MKMIIGLEGRAQVGKTATLNLLIDLLEVATTGCLMPVPQPAGIDRTRIISYKGNSIGIGTGGDYGDAVQKNCDYFESNNCDIVISATRTRGGSGDCLNEFADKHNIKVTWVPKNIVSRNRNQVNLAQAQALFNML